MTAASTYIGLTTVDNTHEPLLNKGRLGYQ